LCGSNSADLACVRVSDLARVPMVPSGAARPILLYHPADEGPAKKEPQSLWDARLCVVFNNACCLVQAVSDPLRRYRVFHFGTIQKASKNRAASIAMKAKGCSL